MRLRVEREADVVTWRQVRTRDCEETGVGPFRFAADAYDRALVEPVHAASPVRDRSALLALARGEPADHREWLDRLVIEEPSFVRQPGLTTMLAGLRAFAAADRPLTEQTAAAWARRQGWEGAGAGILLGIVRAAAADARDPQ